MQKDKKSADRNSVKIRWDMMTSVPAERATKAAVQKMPVPSAYYGSIAVEKGDDFDLSFYACVRTSVNSWAVEWSKFTLEEALDRIAPMIQTGNGNQTLAQVMAFLDKLGAAIRRNMRYVEASVDNRPKIVLDPLPAAYMDMFKAGLLDHRKKSKCLLLDEVEWLTPKDIAGVDWPPHVVPGLVPFAATGSGDHWCWYLPWNKAGNLPVVFSPHDLNTATGFAPNFEGCIYRLVLEQFARSTLLGESSTTRLSKRFMRYAEMLAPFIPRTWARTLGMLAARPIKEDDEVLSVVGEEELKKLVRRDLKFPKLDKKLRQHVA